MPKKYRLNRLLSLLCVSALAYISSQITFADTPPNTMPVEIINNTAIADPSQVYVIIKGNIHGQNSDCFMKVDPASGAATCVTATAGMSSSDYAFTLSSLPKGTDNNGYNLYLPPVDSGRMIFSIKYPVDLTVQVNDLGNTKILDPDGFNPQDSNYNTLYDKAEFTYNDLGVWINPTAVDFFSMPIRIENADSTLKASGFYDKRTAIFNAIQSTITTNDKTPAKAWNNLFVTYQNDDNSTTILRVMAPGKAITGGKKNFNGDYLTGEGMQQSFKSIRFSYIQSLQQYYKTNSVIIDCSEISKVYPADNYMYVGKMNQKGDFVFTNQTNSDSFTIPVAALNTFLFFSGGSKTPGFPAPANNTPGAVIIKFLTSAFDAGLLPAPNNAVLNNAYLQGLKTQYYTTNSLLPLAGQTSDPWYDLYAKAIHGAGGINQPIYAFAYDDALGQDGTLQDPNATSPALTKITLGDMTGTTIPDPYSDDATYNVQFGIPGNSAGQYKVNMINPDGSTTALQSGTTYSVKMPLHLDLVYYNNADIDIYLKNEVIKPSFPGIVIDKTNPQLITINFPGLPQ